MFRGKRLEVRGQKPEVGSRNQRGRLSFAIRSSGVWTSEVFKSEPINHKTEKIVFCINIRYNVCGCFFLRDQDSL